MRSHCRIRKALALSLLVLFGCNSHSAVSDVSYGGGSPFALFVFHFDSLSVGRYTITHVSENGGVTTDVYPFTATGQSGRITINFSKGNASCGSFRSSVTPQLLVFYSGNSRPIRLGRITDKELAADSAVLSPGSFQHRTRWRARDSFT